MSAGTSRIERLTPASVVLLAASLLVVAASARAQERNNAAPARERFVTSHVPGSTVPVELAEGQQLRAGTCGLEGASASGDTTLALIAPNGVQVAFNDDACFSLGSSIDYVVPPGGAGRYEIRASCYGGGGGCGGAIAIEVGVPGPHVAPAPSPPLRVALSGRGAVSTDGDHVAAVGEILIEARPIGPLLIRLGNAPAAIGGGARGGLAGGSLTLTLGFDDGFIALAAGGGISALSMRVGDQRAQESPAFVTFARVGRLEEFHIDAQLATWVIDDALQVLSLSGTARVPLGAVELFARGAGGYDGAVLAELGAVAWVSQHEDGRPELGVSVHAGAAGVFHQPLCRFDVPCQDTRMIIGPALGVGLEWRP